MLLIDGDGYAFTTNVSCTGIVIVLAICLDLNDIVTVLVLSAAGLCGKNLPFINPVVELIDNPEGNPEADQVCTVTVLPNENEDIANCRENESPTILLKVVATELSKKKSELLSTVFFIKRVFITMNINYYTQIIICFLN